MSRMNFVSTLAVAATALTTAGSMLMLPNPAQAEPGCELQFPPIFEITQNDGWHVRIPVGGSPRKQAGGEAVYWKEGKTDPSTGFAMGGMTGNNIDIKVNWSNGSIGEFIGAINTDGYARGRSLDLTHPERNFSWASDQKMMCYTPPSQAAPPPPPPPADQPPPPPSQGLPVVIPN